MAAGVCIEFYLLVIEVMELLMLKKVKKNIQK